MYIIDILLIDTFSLQYIKPIAVACKNNLKYHKNYTPKPDLYKPKLYLYKSKPDLYKSNLDLYKSKPDLCFVISFLWFYIQIIEVLQLFSQTFPPLHNHNLFCSRATSSAYRVATIEKLQQHYRYSLATALLRLFYHEDDKKCINKSKNTIIACNFHKAKWKLCK